MMASYQRPADDLQTDGSMDPDQTGPNQSGASLDQLKSEQARLLQQLQSSDNLSTNEETGNVANPEPNGAMAGSASSDQQRATNKSMTFSDTSSVVSPLEISMPGLQPFPKAGNQLPSSWSDCTLSGAVPFCLVMLNKQSWEFQSILAEFTAADLTVKKIERVENKDLWEKFEFERNRMQKNTTEVNEVYLFHGTTADKEQICHEGLDQRLSRIGYFGRGIYFSNDPRKCVSYTQSDKANPQTSLQTTCTIYKCRALLGNMKVYPPGQHAKTLKREPEVENQEPGGPKYYDSVKGHVKQYDEFILYKSERVMPEYVISCFLPVTSSSQDSLTAPTVVASTNHKDRRDEDLYGGLDQEEVSAELEAGALRRPVRDANGRRENLEEDLYGGADEEISAELEAGALGPPKGNVEGEEVEMVEDEEMSMELTAEGSERLGVGSKDKHPELEDNHPELEEEGDVYEQLHQKEILEAIQKQKREKEEMERQKERGHAGRKERPREEPHGVIVNQLQEERSEELTVRGSDPTNVANKGGKVVPQRPAQLPKSASDPGITVNQLGESRRHKKESIAPEFLPLILEVRERVQESRKKEKEMEQQGQMKRTQSSSERKTPRWVREDLAAAWTPGEYAEQQKLLSKVREKVHADRRAEELEQQRYKEQGRSPGVTDNLQSLGYQEVEEDDGVQEVLDVLLVQFMDVTACEDIVEARECLMKANMDVNKAIISYIN
ncbi:uncharacterized protein LOC119719550 [Patiria miniata]|uniref:Poly [ADP-ribose] polymerase n=1 Tax=Patiria miniata TaxID=46514 RepID=A0A913YZW3_PATMI|nr:uncharacterized protein LOC119719550 [Patiria miniata]XP_038044946.1 uncharacterized protein LOC119719550 [Patiria miniata]XP_038044947.1 uncharacterized protein LOC119719550 [Patiria miniata]